ncbi:MAG: hypothetical protein U9P00_14405 [Pseudomonadota bacterium]|nr:hypothetical protein [Pseudomonadota bacterium]
MKRPNRIILYIALLTSTSALAVDTDAVLGGAIGGGIGAAVGSEVGGREGAIAGGAVGAAIGTALATKDSGHKQDERVIYVEDSHRHGPPGHAYGHRIPPGHAKHKHKRKHY